MRTIKFHSEQKMAPAAREILSLAVRGVFGSEKVKFKKVDTPDPQTLCFGTRGGIRTMSPKQLVSAPNALSVLEQSLRLAAQEARRPSPDDMTYQVVGNLKDFLATVTWMVEVGFEHPVCADIENAPDGTVLSIAVTYGKDIVVFPEEFCQQPHLDKIVHALWAHYYLIGANWKYDSGILLDHTGMMVPVWFDTMLAHHSLHPSATGQHGLKQMAERILGVPDWDKDIQKYTGAGSKGKPKDFSKVPRDLLYKYNCIAEGQPVLTHLGEVPIEQVTTEHLLWDGVEWVTHEGVIDKGTQPVIELDNGLVTTPDHLILTQEGDYVCAAEIAKGNRRTVSGTNASAYRGVHVSHWQGAPREASPSGRDGMLPVWRTVLEACEQSSARSGGRLPLPELGQVWSRPPSEDSSVSVSCYGTTLYSGASDSESAWGQRNRTTLRESGALHSVGTEPSTARDLRGGTVRPDRWVGALRAGESALGYSTSELDESSGQRVCAVHGSGGCEAARLASGEGGSTGLPGKSLRVGGGATTRSGSYGVPGQPKTARVFDILNAGPRHRFTVSGVVVSNCYDVYYTFMLYEYLLPQITLDGPYWTEQYWANGFVWIENNRVHLDIDAVVNLRDSLIEQEAEHEAWLAEFGIANVRSPKQIKDALTTSVPTLAGTDKATLEAYQDHEEIGEAVTHLLEYRRLQKQRATYCDAYLRYEQDGFIHPTINIHGTASGRMSGSEPNCVSGDTEVLTPQGWVRFDAYEDGTEVFQVDAETGVGTFVLPEKVHRVQTEKFFEVAAEWGTFLYTPDHRIPSYNREGVLRWDTAQTWADQWEGREVIIDRKVRRAATKESVVPTPEDLRALHLAIIVQAEGYFMPRKRVSDKFEISVTSERKRRQLHEVFGDRVGGNERRARVVLDASEVGDWISQDAVKVFNAEKILTLPSYLLDWFVQMVMIWDGDSTRGCTYGQTGQRKKSVDVVQAAAALCGRSTSIYENPNNDIYTVNVHQDALRHQSRTTITEVTGGAAFCVTVPTGAFMIRRGGAVLVTGNCQNVPRDKVIRNLFTARSEDRVLISCDYSQAELRAQAILSGDERMIAAFQPGAGDYFDLLAPIMFPREFENLEAYKALKVEDKAAAKEFRAKIKGVIYGSGFGRGAAAIGRAIGSTKEEAQTILDNFLNGYPDYKIWRQKVIEAASNPEKREFLTGPYNLIFDTEVITWRNRSSVERSALSFLPQNIVSYLCTTAAVRINDRLRSEYPDALVVMAVHDDILVDCPKDLVEPVGRIMQEEMIRIGCETYGDAVLFDAEPESTYRWGALVD